MTHHNPNPVTAVTHPGSAHRDEFLSCCLLVAAGKVDRIERRDPTDEDMADPKVLVLDQGGVHDPERLNFDHHQFDRDADPVCSITLILPYLGIDVETARDIWSWLEYSELLDSKGPYETAHKLGSDPDALFAAVSPVETTVLRWFEFWVELNDPERTLGGHEMPVAPLFDLMRRIGKEKLDYLNEVVKRYERLDEEAIVYRESCLPQQGQTPGRGFLPSRELPVQVVDATCIPRDENPTMGLEAWIERFEDKDCDRPGLPSEGYQYRGIAVTITQDDRGEGLCIFRRNDDPQIDFSVLEDEDGVAFAHKGGFVAKLEAGVDPLPMIEKAFTGVSV